MQLTVRNLSEENGRAVATMREEAAAAISLRDRRIAELERMVAGAKSEATQLLDEEVRVCPFAVPPSPSPLNCTG